MKLENRPWLVYFISFLALLGSFYLFIFSEGFLGDIMVELIGAVIFILIIDQLLLRSQRKRWRVVKHEIEHILSRTLNSLRDDILLNMFAFKPDISTGSVDLEQLENSVKEQKASKLEDLYQLESEQMFEMIKNNYLSRKYEDLFLEKAEDLWRILNTKYLEHLNPEEVKLFLALHLHLRDLHAGLKTYLKGQQETGKKEYYQQKGQRSIIHNTREIIENLIELRKMGYQPSSLYIEEEQ